MQSKKLDILADKRKQNGQVLMMLANYCRKHRMLDINLGCLSLDAMDRIGNEIADLFVDRVGLHQKKTPPETGAQSNKGKAGSQGLSRG
ncbi:hypothetical protein PSA7680_02115 [Pseudoruegeria aquimaris]|uniref:Uncharacterized protein n=1 Tax=Pseudoruegeria aquimaris TaxID=393663 RepID=A0A1Y5SPG3_9RHOB|nr:hypothetical protein [Pseudoruegeria aquimaris]SLN42355.1 hypothetical protein PSA7680_02115 [Pseudoruegeria aquimaris]